ncbi:MAG: potassium channel family protein [Bacilli bacterium]
MKRLLAYFYRYTTLSLTAIFLLVLFSSSSIITYLDPHTFPRWMDGFYWTMTTIATVGYGDLSPQTDNARLFAMFLMVIGIVIHAAFVGKIIDLFTSYSTKKKEGRLSFMYKNHLIVVYFTKKSRRFMQRYLEANEHENIVLIDTKSVCPYDHPRVHYIQGLASRIETYHQANAKESKTVMFFSDPKYRDDHEAGDGKTLLNASVVESHFPNAHTLVELLDEKNAYVFRNANIDEYIYSEDLASKLAVLGAMHPGKIEEIRKYIKELQQK